MCSFEKRPSYPPNPPLASANRSLSVSTNESLGQNCAVQLESTGKTLEGSPDVRASMCRHGPGKSTCNAAGEVNGGEVRPAGGVGQVCVDRGINSIGSFLILLVFFNFSTSEQQQLILR